MMTELPTAFPSSGPTQCAYHPDTETRLRCSRCGKPICPRCGVRTPVGMRCPDCSGTRPTVAVNPAGTLRAAAVGLVVAALAGVGWSFFPEWGFYWALLLGFGSVETMVHFLRGRTGFDLQAIAIAVVLFGVVLSRVVLAWRLGIDVGDVNDFTRLAQRALYLRPIPDLLFAAFPVLIAWIRFR